MENKIIRFRYNNFPDGYRGTLIKKDVLKQFGSDYFYIIKNLDGEIYDDQNLTSVILTSYYVETKKLRTNCFWRNSNLEGEVVDYKRPFK